MGVLHATVLLCSLQAALCLAPNNNALREALQLSINEVHSRHQVVPMNVNVQLPAESPDVGGPAVPQRSPNSRGEGNPQPGPPAGIPVGLSRDLPAAASSQPRLSLAQSMAAPEVKVIAPPEVPPTQQLVERQQAPNAVVAAPSPSHSPSQVGTRPFLVVPASKLTSAGPSARGGGAQSVGRIPSPDKAPEVIPQLPQTGSGDPIDIKPALPVAPSVDQAAGLLTRAGVAAVEAGQVVTSGQETKTRSPSPRQAPQCPVSIDFSMIPRLDLSLAEFDREYLLPALGAHLLGGPCRSSRLNTYLERLLQLRYWLYSV